MRIRNVTRGCRSVSILSPVPLEVATPYDPLALPEGRAEDEIRVFDVTRTAMGGPMAPLDTYVDVENKKTIVTLGEQASHFINGVLKNAERPEKSPASFSEQTIKPVLEVDPAAGLPMIKAPEPNTDGDLRLSYPLEFPGARPSLKPSVSIGYSAQGIGGNIAEGWRLSVPAISVETRWGVPVYDSGLETETYLFNGEQLVPEAGDYFADAADAEALGTKAGDASETPPASHYLVPQPHRTARLRPRKGGKAHFVLRRDEGLWRFVRHGDTPASYWWEAWQENPANDAKVMYFGRAPGRLSFDVPAYPVEKDAANVAVLRRDGQAETSPIMRWGLAREKDAFGNIIDYEWQATCRGCANGTVTGLPKDRDLYPVRVLYSHHASLEETILRCAEKPDLKGCSRKQALYEMRFHWEDSDAFQARSEARSGGLTVSRKLLGGIDVRLRRRVSKAGGTLASLSAPHWQCSRSFLGYAFHRTNDPLFPNQGARRWLNAVEKKSRDGGLMAAGAEEAALFPENGLSGGVADLEQETGCAQGVDAGLNQSYRTSFSYYDKSEDGTKRALFASGASGSFMLTSSFEAVKHGDMIDSAGNIVKRIVGGNDGTSGPFSSSFLGSSVTAETSGGLFLGIGVGGKSPGAGINVQNSDRTRHNETTMMLDVDGDGINDLLINDQGRWKAFRGKLDALGRLSFAEEMPHALPHGFRFQHEPVSSSSNTGFEGYFDVFMAGNTSGSTSTVQRTYLADVDGDGRVDVVTPAGVFYNRAHQAASVDRLSFWHSSPFIGLGAVSSSDVTLPAAEKPPATPSPADLSSANPRYDGTRLWRAPLDGEVLVRGEVRFVGTDDALKPPKSGAAPDPDLREEQTYRARDGVVVSVEKSSGLVTRVCDKGLLGPGRFTPTTDPEPEPGRWKLEGSLSVRNSPAGQPPRLASYFISLENPVDPGPHAMPFGFTGLPADMDTGALIAKAVAEWNARYAPAPSPPLLTYAAGTLTYAGKGDMRPLILTVPVQWPTLDDNSAFKVTLGAQTLETRVYRDAFVPQAEACAANAAKASQLRQELGKAGVEGGLLASVKAGDVLFFRVHSIDDGAGDAVEWNPQIAYVQASAAPRGTPQPRDTLLQLVPQPSLVERGRVLTQAAACDPANLTPLCAEIYAILRRQTTLCGLEETRFGLCDAFGRSMLRFRAAARELREGQAVAETPPERLDPADWPVLTAASGEFHAPYAGRYRLKGTFWKPETGGVLQLRYALIDPARRPKIGTDPAPDTSCTELGQDAFDFAPGGSLPAEKALLTKGVVPLRKQTAAGAGASTLIADVAAGEYDIDTDTIGALVIGQGQRLCLAFRHFGPGQSPQGPSSTYWPFDAARLRLHVQRPVTIEFDRVIEFIPENWFELLPGTDEPKAIKTPAGKAEAPLAECGLTVAPSTPKKMRAVCAKIEGGAREGYYVSPHAIHGALTSLSLLRDAQGKPLHREEPILRGVALSPFQPEPASKFCTTPGEVERRVRLDIDMLSGRKPEEERPALSKPAAARFAHLRTAISATRTMRLPSGTGDEIALADQVPVPVRLFAIKDYTTSARQRWVSLTADHLAMKPPAASEGLIMDHRGAMAALDVDFSRTEAVNPLDDSDLLAGVAAHVRFEEAPGSVVELPMRAVGFAFCARPDDVIMVSGALDAYPETDPLREASARNLLGTGCIKARLQPLLVSNSCPIEQAQVRYPVADKAKPGAFTLEGEPLNLMIDPLRRAFGAEAMNPSLSRHLAPLTPRGAQALAVRYMNPAGLDPALICDPLATDTPRPCLPDANTLAGVLPLTPYQKLLAASPLNPGQAATVQATLKNNSQQTCDGSSAAAGTYPAPGGDLDQSDNCQQMSKYSPVQNNFAAYPLGVGYRTGRFAFDDAKRPSAKRGEGQEAATGPPLLDRACAAPAMAWSHAENASNPLNTARQAQASATARTWSDPRPPHLCATGPDPAIFVFEEIVAASRIGVKNIHQGKRRELYELNRRIKDAANAPALSRGQGKGLQGLPKLSRSRLQSSKFSFYSNSTSLNAASVEMMDLNGDGFPDIISMARVVHSDPSGGLRCAEGGVWSKGADCRSAQGLSPDLKLDTGALRRSTTRSEGYGGTIGSMVQTFSKVTGNAMGQLSATMQGIGRSVGNTTVMAPFGSVAMDLGDSNGTRDFDLTDINNDGLPDIARMQAGKLIVRLNLGYRYSDPIEWPAGGLMQDKGNSRGLGLSPSYSTAKDQFSGGMSTNTSVSGQSVSLLDINGDGLSDLVTLSSEGALSVALGTGSGLTATTPWIEAPANALSRSETDRVWLGGSFTILIPIPIPFTNLVIVINPSFSQSETLTRQTLMLKDMDGDGLPDLVVGGGLYSSTPSRFPFEISKLGFSNQQAQVYPNALAKHGLLKGVQQAGAQQTTGILNYEFEYARTGPSARDPHHRYVHAVTVTRDGVSLDDETTDKTSGVTANARATCYFYAGGFFDRYERKFLGYSTIEQLEGCRDAATGATAQLLDSSAGLKILTADSPERARFHGLRRTLRHYANASVYEAGLLLRETVHDLTPSEGKAPGVLMRVQHHTHVLADTAGATHARRLCQRLRTKAPDAAFEPIERQVLGIGFVRNVMNKPDDKGEAGCAGDLGNEPAKQDNNDPSFDKEPRRLTPIKVQTLVETYEGADPAKVMRTAMQFDMDHRARPVRVCDLGSLYAQGTSWATRGALCTGIGYDESVRPAFTHGATGGGTVLVEQRNRIKRIGIVHFRAKDGPNDAADASDDMRPQPVSAQDHFQTGMGLSSEQLTRLVRQRSASHDPRTGAMVALCSFERPASGQPDPCASLRHFPQGAGSVKALAAIAARQIALRSYDYDDFGNLRAFIGPMAAGESFIRKDYRYDAYLNMVETSEQTHICTPASAGGAPDLQQPAVSKEPLCLDQASHLGALVSLGAGIDYRFAQATLQSDVNGNLFYTRPDGFGRAIAHYASWVEKGPICSDAATCPLKLIDTAEVWKHPGLKIEPKGSAALKLIATTRYELAASGPVAVVDRLVSSTLYGGATPVSSLKTAMFADHFGTRLQTISPAEACALQDVSCAKAQPYVASALAIKDTLGRPVYQGYPRAVDRAAPETGGLVPSSGPASKTSYDGRDRVRLVQLPDGNAFDFHYEIGPSFRGAGSPLRHHAYSRNAVCTAQAIERDERGAIRAVVESFGEATLDGQKTAALGSAAPALLAGQVPQLLAPETDGLDATPFPFGPARTRMGIPQQTAACRSGERGQGFALAGVRSITGYDRDALGQLVAVRLPERASAPSGGEKAAILIGYDAAGRRMAVADPDRGFERVLHDPAGNAVCRYTLPGKTSLDPADLTTPEAQQLMTGACPLAPSFQKKTEGVVRRVVESRFAGALPLQVRHREFGDDAGRERRLTFHYGQNLVEDRAGNSIGRLRQVEDAAGTQRYTYDGLGRKHVTTRDFAGLTALDPKAPAAKATITEAYDVWGLLASRTVEAAYPGLTTPINHTLEHRYNAGGQLISLETRNNADAAQTSILREARYDERGNLRTLHQSGDVVTRNTFMLDSNRLAQSSAELPPVGGVRRLFQNLSYAYDPAGNVVAYDNRPSLIAPCDAMGECIYAFLPAKAREAGLLISESENAFAYDQLNRIRTARKALASVGNWKSRHPNLFEDRDAEGEPQLFTNAELDKAQALRVSFDETFAFERTHEMALRRQETRQSVGALAFPKDKPGPVGGKAAQVELSRYRSDNAPRHAPGVIETTVTGDKQSAKHKTEFYFDNFGRMHHAGCDVTSGKGVCLPYRFLHWNADDTLRLTIEQADERRLSDAQEKKLDAWSYRVLSEFDHGGARVYKSTALALYKDDHGKTTGGKPEKVEPLSDTLYVDAGLTITRTAGGAPQAALHYFAGGARVASQWLGDKRVFSYHAQLQTRNVTDVVVTEPSGAGSTSRLLGQQEYAAFGAVLHEREIALDPTLAKKNALPLRRLAGLPAFRFNAKEQDDSGLQDFGARFYDNRMALWLRPDPVLHDYLDGKHSGGVYAPKNLASYGFGWGNPVSFVDADGRASGQADDGVRTSITYSHSGGVGPFNYSCSELGCKSNIPDFSSGGEIGLNVFGFGFNLGFEEKSLSLNYLAVSVSGTLDRDNNLSSLKFSAGIMEKNEFKFKLGKYNIGASASAEAGVFYEHISKSAGYFEKINGNIGGFGANQSAFGGLKRIDKLPETVYEAMREVMINMYQSYGGMNVRGYTD